MGDKELVMKSLMEDYLEEWDGNIDNLKIKVANAYLEVYGIIPDKPTQEYIMHSLWKENLREEVI